MKWLTRSFFMMIDDKTLIKILQIFFDMILITQINYYLLQKMIRTNIYIFFQKSKKVNHVRVTIKICNFNVPFC